MIELGMTLAWLAVQVSLVMVPAADRSRPRRTPGPRGGGVGRDARPGTGRRADRRRVPAACWWRGGRLVDAARRRRRHRSPRRAAGRSDRDLPGRPIRLGHWPPAGWRIAWDRLERGAAEPAARCRPWAPASRRSSSPPPPPEWSGWRSASGGRRLPASRPARQRSGAARPARRAPQRDRLPRRGRPPRGARPGRTGHGGLAPAGDPAPRGLAIVGRLADRRAVLAHELAHVVRGDLRGRPPRPAGPGASRLSPPGPLDGRSTPTATGAGGRRDGRPARGRKSRLPRDTLATGPEAGWTVPLLAGEGVPPGAGDPDQEDHDVAR